MKRGVVVALLLATACIPQRERPLRPPVAPAPQPSIGSAATRQCLADLGREGIAYRPLPDRLFENGCSALGSVQLTDFGIATTNLGAMTCPLALRFARWGREIVQPAAQQWLRSRVVRIESFGTYGCRSRNSQPGARMSEHGRANAVDIGAFVLADGRRITVLDGWRSADGNVRGFLHALHDAGCRRFSVTLGPDANAYHQNHFHFDLGPDGPYCR